MNWHHLKQHIDKGRFSCDFERRALACAYEMRNKPTVKWLGQKYNLTSTQVASIKERYYRSAHSSELIAEIQSMSKRYLPAPTLSAKDRRRLKRIVSDVDCPLTIKRLALFALLIDQQVDKQRLLKEIPVSRTSLSNYKKYWREQTNTDDLWERYQTAREQGLQ